MRCLLVTVSGYADDFRFEHGDAMCQFVLRIGIKQFPRQLAGCVAFGAGTIIEFHYG